MGCGVVPRKAVHRWKVPFTALEDIKRPTEAILSPSCFSLLSPDCTRVSTSHVDSNFFRLSVPWRFVPGQRCLQPYLRAKLLA